MGSNKGIYVNVYMAYVVPYDRLLYEYYYLNFYIGKYVKTKFRLYEQYNFFFDCMKK